MGSARGTLQDGGVALPLREEQPVHGHEEEGEEHPNPEPPKHEDGFQETARTEED